MVGSRRGAVAACGARTRYRCVMDKVNIHNLQNKPQRRIHMITETANKLSKLDASA